MNIINLTCPYCGDSFGSFNVEHEAHRDRFVTGFMCHTCNAAWDEFGSCIQEGDEQAVKDYQKDL